MRLWHTHNPTAGPQIAGNWRGHLRDAGEESESPGGPTAKGAARRAVFTINGNALELREGEETTLLGYRFQLKKALLKEGLILFRDAATIKLRSSGR